MNALAILFSPLGRWLMVAVAIGGLVGLNQCTAKSRDHWKAEDAKHVSELRAARLEIAESERRRKAEQRRAVAAISEAEGACDARVDQARRSARTIRQIIERPVATDANNCPLRPVVGTDSLRDALQPAAGAHRP